MISGKRAFKNIWYRILPKRNILSYHLKLSYVFFIIDFKKTYCNNYSGDEDDSVGCGRRTTKETMEIWRLWKTQYLTTWYCSCEPMYRMGCVLECIS